MIWNMLGSPLFPSGSVVNTHITLTDRRSLQGRSPQLSKWKQIAPGFSFLLFVFLRPFCLIFNFSLKSSLERIAWQTDSLTDRQCALPIFQYWQCALWKILLYMVIHENLLVNIVSHKRGCVVLCLDSGHVLHLREAKVNLLTAWETSATRHRVSSLHSDYVIFSGTSDFST